MLEYIKDEDLVKEVFNYDGEIFMEYMMREDYAEMKKDGVELPFNSLIYTFKENVIQEIGVRFSLKNRRNEEFNYYDIEVETAIFIDTGQNQLEEIVKQRRARVIDKEIETIAYKIQTAQQISDNIAMKTTIKDNVSNIELERLKSLHIEATKKYSSIDKNINYTEILKSYITDKGKNYELEKFIQKSKSNYVCTQYDSIRIGFDNYVYTKLYELITKLKSKKGYRKIANRANFNIKVNAIRERINNKTEHKSRYEWLHLKLQMPILKLFYRCKIYA